MPAQTGCSQLADLVLRHRLAPRFASTLKTLASAHLVTILYSAEEVMAEEYRTLVKTVL